MLAVLRERAPKTACPSEFARSFATDWRPLLGRVRDAVIALRARGRVDVLQCGRAVDPVTARGPIRLRYRG